MPTSKMGFVVLFVAMFLASGTAFGQGSEINRVEFFGGYSHNRLDTGLTSDDIDDEIQAVFPQRLGAHGVNFSITGNVSKYVGLKFDLATHSKTESATFEGDTYSVKDRVTNYLGGVQFKNNAKDGPRFKPFAHVLAGIANQTITLSGPPIKDEGLSTGELFKINQSNFALAIGGGLDIRVHKRVDIRVFQFDWNPTYLKEQEFDGVVIDGMMQNNYRFGFGIVIH